MNDYFDSFAFWLADYYLTTTVLLVQVLAALAMLKQPVRRLAVSKAALVTLALLAVLCAIPGWSVVHLIAARGENAPAVINRVEKESASAKTIPSLSATKPKPETDSTPSPSLEVPQKVAAEWPKVSPLHAIGAIHVTGSVIVLAWLALGALAARRLLRHARPAPGELHSLMAQLVTPNTRRVELLVSERIDVAAALGVRRPIVLLPSSWIERRPYNELRTVLAHEVAHVRNGDLAWLAASRVLLLFLWAQPLYWLLRHRLRLDQEVLADAAAAEHAGRQQYAEQLVTWARGLSAQPKLMLPAAVGLWEGPSQLRRRVALLLDERLTLLRDCSRAWKSAATAILVLTATALSLTTLNPSRAGDGEKSSAAAENVTVHSAYGPAITGTFVAGPTPAGPTFKKNVLTLTVQDEADKPLAGVDAIVYRASIRTGEREFVKQATTDDRGEIAFSDLVPQSRANEIEQLAAKSKSPPLLGDIMLVVLRRQGLGTVMLMRSENEIALHGFRQTVRMRPAADLSGSVTDHDGKPVAGATVAAGSWAGSFAIEGANTVKTDAQGRYRFTDRIAFDVKAARNRGRQMVKDSLAAQGGTNDVIVSVFDPAVDISISDLVLTHPDYAVTSVRGGDVPGTTNVVMEPAATIVGRVFDFATGKPAPGVEIHAAGNPTPRFQKGTDDTAADDVTFDLASLHTAWTRTDAEGHYQLANLPAGKYNVWAQPPTDDWSKIKWISRAVEDVKADMGDRPITAPDLTIGPGGTIRGQLVDALSGEPLAVGDDGPTVKTMFQFVDQLNRQQSQMQQVPVTPDGRFEIRAFPGKLRVFVMVNLHQDGGQPQGDYRSGDDFWKAGQVFNLGHGESTEAKFPVWSHDQLEESRAKMMRGFKATNEGKYDEAVAAFGEVLATDPTNVTVLVGRAQAYERMGRFSEALADYEVVAEMAPGSGQEWYLADLLATAPDAKVRDGRRAVKLATEALEAARGNPPNAQAESIALGLLAAAQAESGEFEQAVVTQREAIERTPERGREDMRVRLKLYESKQPYHRPAK